jgi:hypothetical protein
VWDVLRRADPLRAAGKVAPGILSMKQPLMNFFRLGSDQMRGARVRR